MAFNRPPGLLANAATGGIVEASVKPSVLTVTSISPISPSGLSVYVDNLILEGQMAVSGQLPFLGTIALDGSLPTSGQGVATCGCGNGQVGMVSEGVPAGVVY